MEFFPSLQCYCKIVFIQYSDTLDILGRETQGIPQIFVHN